LEWRRTGKKVRDSNPSLELLCRASLAELLGAQAIREGKNLEAIVIEILGA